MVASQLALAALLIAAADPEPVTLTPTTIAEHGFHLESTFVRPKNAQRDSDAGTLHLRLGRGPGGSYRDLEAIKSISLVVRDGDTVVLSAPVRAEFDPSNYVSLHAKLQVQKELLSKMQLVFSHDGADGAKKFVVKLEDFTKVWPAERN